MTFGGQVPSPMLRARVGDTVDLTVENHPDNDMPHNVDLHACRGPAAARRRRSSPPASRPASAFG